MSKDNYNFGPGRDAPLQPIKYVHENARARGRRGGETKFRTRDKDKLNQHEIMSV